MDMQQVAEVVNATLGMLPEAVRKTLVDVEFVVAPDVATAEAEIRAVFDEDPFEPGETPLAADMKAMFVGEPLSHEEDDDDTEIVELPEGVIALVASNLSTNEEVHIALLHEVGHALDFDESEVAQLGLSGMEPHAGKVPSNGQPGAGG